MYVKISKRPNFVQLEQEILKFWDKNSIFSKVRKKNAAGPPWSFIDGPITANNPMGVHHAWGRSLKDMFQRFHAMHGHELRYQNGFDCQGLWVEVEVEKEHGFHSKRDINEYGIEKFVRDCKERVLTYAARQTEQSVRLGYWMDWDDPDTLLKLRDALHEGVEQVTITTPNGTTVTDSPEQLIGQLGSPEHGGSYFTFSSENNYSIWGFLQRCHHEGFIYRGTNVMPWCPRCGTGLSHMEISEGRKITTHTSVFVRFPIVGRGREAFLVWTTTPWTLTSNVAVALNPEMTYLKVRIGDWTYYIGKENYNTKRIQELEAEGKRQTAKLPSLAQILKTKEVTPEVLGEIAGKELIGLTYQGPFDDLPAQNIAGGLSPVAPDGNGQPTAVECHQAIAWKEISGAEGTGIVHIAPGCGAEDYALGKQNNLVSIAPLDENGIFTKGFGVLTGSNVSSVVEQILSELKERGLLVAKEQYPHVYPHCWRCKTELVFRLVDGWYIRMDWREKIQKIVPDIKWIPADGEAREQDWLRNMGDWLVSKKRFWGLTLPIWECEECDWFTVIGSKEELKEKAVSGWEHMEHHTPHRPYIDEVKICCEKCGATARRVEDVGNPWLDAGIVPFSTLRYNTDREYWDKWFPSELVIECFPGQFRNWFYALLAMSAQIDGRAPFRTLLGHALVRDEHGEEMHKSKGNAIYFDEAAEVLGAEVMRYLYASQNPTANLSFPDLRHQGGVNHPDVEVRRKLLTLWNCYSFFVNYAITDNWTPPVEATPLAEREELDRWILSRLQGLIGAADNHFRGFAIHRFMAHLEQFNDELSNWYLRRSRRRFWNPGMDSSKHVAYETLYETLDVVVRLLAPILPFLSEYIYQNLVANVKKDAPESVHLTSYPLMDQARVDEALEQRVNVIIRIKNMGLGARNQCNIKIRQPLQRITVKPRNDIERDVLNSPALVQQILEECNIKELEVIDTEDGQITTRAQLNFKTLGPKLGKQVQQAKSILASLDLAEIYKTLCKEGKFELVLDGETSVELSLADILFSHEAGENAVVLEDEGTFVILDTHISAELKQEGLARDFNRQVQNLRKEAGLELTDRIHVSYTGSITVAEAIDTHKAFLCSELLADDIVRVESLATPNTVKVGEEKIQVSITG